MDNKMSGNNSVESITMSIESNSDLNNGSVILESEEFNETERDMMKGDTVGDTVYSAKWIISALISLSKVSEDGWSKALENDLCMLWDMTTDKDVVHFLVENDFYKVADFVLRSEEEPRIIEIVIGIIGNMCCHDEGLHSLVNMEELISLILNFLSSDDPETLIQILRLLQATIWDISTHEDSLWKQRLKDCNFLGETLAFILNSSINNQLLLSTIDLLESLSTVILPKDPKLFTNWFNTNQLVIALVESFEQLNKNQNSSQLELKTINNWITILSNVIQFNVIPVKDIIELNYDSKVVEVLVKILEPYQYTCNIMPLESRSAFCIEHSVEIIMWLYKNQSFISLEILRVIMIIMITLNSALELNFDQEDQKDFNTENELLDYLEKWWMSILGTLQKEELSTMLQLCEDRVTNNLMKFTQLKGNVPADDIQKLHDVLNSLGS